MLYKIESIKHSRGTLKGLDRQDDRYPMRIGRIISLDIDDILIDFPLIIKYVRDSDGTPMRNLVLRTSFVKSFEYIKDENVSKKQIPGSVSFVPSCAGLIIAGEVIKDIIKKWQMVRLVFSSDFSYIFLYD